MFFGRSHSIWRIFGAAVVLLGMVAAQVTFLSAARATSFQNDPSVVIAKDITTRDGPCTQRRVTIQGTHREASPSYPCPPGTFLIGIVAPRSQALMQHEPYIPIPANTESSVLLQQEASQTAYLFAEKRLELRKGTSGGNAAVHPTTCAGTTDTIYTNADINADFLDLSVTYYIPRSCANITIDNTTIMAETYYNPLYWLTSCYYWGGIHQPCFLYGCGTLAPPYHTHVNYIDASEPGGGDFFEALHQNNNCWPPFQLISADLGTLYE